MGPGPALPEAPPAGRRGGVDLAEIFRTDGEAYRRTHCLNRVQRRAMRAIETCRTAALGGHRDVCDRCGAERLSYNSCRNRHCPKCQGLATARWIDARQRRVCSPSQYFHVVFTLPRAAARPVSIAPPALTYTLLFRTTAATLSALRPSPPPPRRGAGRHRGPAHLDAAPALVEGRTVPGITISLVSFDKPHLVF